ncbi:MAG: D-alanyl-D-alanine carboxypeptidase family protein [Clostridia bacterium]|nr:D-alanyl-D-alanine carboxypeptidase family protein [Clostridia bacterium]
MIYDTKLVLSCNKEDGYRYNFTWNDTGDEQYTLQQKDEKGNWKDIGTFTDAFGTDVIFDEPFSETSYRMITYNKESDTVTLSNEECLLYSTIWPIKDLSIYSDPSGTKAIGIASKGRAYCIIGSENGRFEILYKDGNGYIDSSYCMVDLYEVYGDLMAYDISNSHDSLFAFHEYSIPDITDTVIRGYEDIKVGDRYVVPLLYPVCERLEKAALDAREKGYRLKIYESFRPQKATRYVHDTAKTFSEGIISGKGITYIDYITDNGRYSIDRFLANGTSRHNRGVALDLTLERDGEELHMQTVMHDLSWYSETRRNNEEAELLKEIMKGQGFAGLTSEWWHFQDDEIKERLSPPPLYEGVNIECLVKDDRGIRYRYKDGTFAVDTAVVIDDTDYHFDENGYLKKEGEI